MMDSDRFEELPPSPSISNSSSGTFHDPEDEEPSPAVASPSSSPKPPPAAPPVADQDDDEDAPSVWWTPSELRVSSYHSCLAPSLVFADLATRSLQDILDRSTALKVQGNAAFGKGRWEEAMEAYKEGLVELPARPTKGKGKEKAVEGAAAAEEGVEEVVEKLNGLQVEVTEQEEQEKSAEQAEMKELTELRSILFANVAACCLKLVSVLSHSSIASLTSHLLVGTMEAGRRSLR